MTLVESGVLNVVVIAVHANAQTLKQENLHMAIHKLAMRQTLRRLIPLPLTFQHVDAEWSNSAN